MDSPIALFKSGVQNLLQNEVIPQDAAQDALGFVTQDGKEKLIPGRLLLGADSGTVGILRGLWYGYKVDGSLVLYRKTETKIQYWNGAAWTDAITGLTVGTEASFANYSSLAGAFTFVVTTDGYWKFNNVNPGNPIQLYDATRNFHGRIFIDKGRTILWDRNDSGTRDRTGLYGSKIDPQNATVYTIHSAEAHGNGDGANKNFTGNLNYAAPNNGFGVQPYGQIAGTLVVTAITQALQAQITAVAHGLIVGDRALIAGVVGMTQINGIFLTVLTVVDANNITVAVDTTNMTAYGSGGTLQKVELFADDYLGNLRSNLGGTGTINYVTGAFVLAFNTAPIAASPSVWFNYQTENSNNGGVSDFRHSATRLAGEGFIVPQDKGGDPIMNVLIGEDGAYYSLKQQRAYRFALDDTDLNPTNDIFYENMGIPSTNSGIATQKGIVFLNTSNPDKPEMTILQKNLVSATLLPAVIFPGFRFADYDYSDAYFDTYERYIVVSCKTQGAVQNNRILLCNLSDGSVNISPYEARMFAKDSLANLYVGSPLQENTYQIYNGFDDLGNPINAYWIGAANQYGGLKSRQARWRFIREELKKFRKFYIKGMISLDQTVEVWISYDDAPFQQIGTILGRGTYVDAGSGESIGSNFIGGVPIGGDQLASIFQYFCEIKIKKQPKFRKRTIKIVPTGIGYFDFNFQSDFDIMLFENRLPARFRSKQNVSLDGTEDDVPNGS